MEVQGEGQIQDPGPSPEAGDTDVGSEAGEVSAWQARLDDQEAKIDMLNDTISNLTRVISSSQNQAQAPVEDDLDDDEPLTGSKAQKIVQKAVTQAVSQSQKLNSRQSWDEKAKTDFPLKDPKFMREFKREWDDMTSDGGLDPNHPKSVYKVCQMVAKTYSPKAQKSTSTSNAQTSEAPTPPPRGASLQTGASRKVTVAEDDVRVRFYKMKGNRTKEQVQTFMAQLSEKDEKAERRGRR